MNINTYLQGHARSMTDDRERGIDSISWYVGLRSPANTQHICTLYREGIITFGDVNEYNYEVVLTEHGINMLEFLALI
jgi:hypothetical protein